MRTATDLQSSPESEGARGATVDSGARNRLGAPDPEVVAQAKRRRFTTEYKLRILREADACKAHGELGALLRREGLYSSQLSTWRMQREQMTRTGMKARKRGPKARVIDPKVKKLEHEIERLRKRLEEAETIIDFQKKLSDLLGISLKPHDREGSD